MTTSPPSAGTGTVSRFRSAGAATSSRLMMAMSPPCRSQRRIDVRQALCFERDGLLHDLLSRADWRAARRRVGVESELLAIAEREDDRFRRLALGQHAEAH